MTTKTNDSLSEGGSKRKQGNPKWIRGMESPNKSGRPRGIVDRRAKLNKLLEGKAESVLNVVIDAALEKDVQAASLILSRVMPILKQQDERVEFELDIKAPMSGQVEQILKALSEGLLSSDMAKQIIETVGVLDSIRQAESLNNRVAKLEAR